MSIPVLNESLGIECRTVAERVSFIADVMRRGEWVRGETGVMLAKLWDLSLSRVEDLSAEAWRRVCDEADDIETVRPTIAGTLLVNLHRASERGAFREVAQLGDVLARVVGNKQASRLTEEEARKKYRELTGQDWPGPKESKK